MASLLRRLLRFLGLAGRAQTAPPPAPDAPQASAAAPRSPAPPQAHRPEPMLGATAPYPGNPTFPMPQLVVMSGGWYPTRNGGPATPQYPIGMIQAFAGLSPAYGSSRAQGQMLPINANQQLFSIYGTNFGMGGNQQFGLPNLNNRSAVGGTPIGQMSPQWLTLTAMIAAYPSSTAPFPGMIAFFGAGFAPDGWLVADGSMLSISQHVDLFEAIGTTFGGNPAITFNLPNLNGWAPVGAGQGLHRAPVALGQQVSGAVPGLGLNYLICLYGAIPTPDGDFPATGQFAGQVIAYAGPQPPQGWAPCDGSLQLIADNPGLFEVIGTTYGGDGETNFALPDLRGVMLTGM